LRIYIKIKIRRKIYTLNISKFQHNFNLFIEYIFILKKEKKMERRNSKGKKPFNYKRNRSNSGSSYSGTDNKKNFKHPRGKNDRNNIENSNHKKFNNGPSTKKNKCNFF